MKPALTRRALPVMALLATAFFPRVACADAFNMPVGVTALSREIYDLHMLIFWICVVIGVVVFGAMLWSMIAHRKAEGREPANFHESLKLELAWTIVPVFILVGMAIPATDVLIKMYDTGGEDLVIEVRGYQWKWQYKYLDENLNEQVSFFSRLATPRAQIQNQQEKSEHYLLEVDNPLVIPLHRKVRFLLTANDVIHSWWVPDLGFKMDAIPGFVNDGWVIVDEPGIYRGQCTELCGKDHGFMPVVVRVVSQDEFNDWYAERLGNVAVVQETRAAEAAKVWSGEELYARGQAVYEAHCTTCHQVDGTGVPPVFPAIAGSALATGPIDEHIEIIYSGRAGTAMQAFGQQLTETELAAVLHYQRNAFGNAVGDVVQPEDVIAYLQAR